MNKFCEGRGRKLSFWNTAYRKFRGNLICITCRDIAHEIDIDNYKKQKRQQEIAIKQRLLKLKDVRR